MLLPFLAGIYVPTLVQQILADKKSGDDAADTAPNTTYCGIKIPKNTQTSTNATQSFEWLVEFLDAFCQSEESCRVGCRECGHALRASLPPIVIEGRTCGGGTGTTVISIHDGCAYCGLKPSRFASSSEIF